MDFRDPRDFKGFNATKCFKSFKPDFETFRSSFMNFRPNFRDFRSDFKVFRPDSRDFTSDFKDFRDFTSDLRYSISDFKDYKAFQKARGFQDICTPDLRRSLPLDYPRFISVPNTEKRTPKTGV